MFINQSIFIKIYIIPTILISPIMTISCNSWFSIWMSMELNLMAFIPLILITNKFNKELSMKYFIIQALGSSLLILSSNSFLFKINNFMMTNLTMMISLSLLLKMGAAPFHFWFIDMMKNLNWINCMILSTWQKIIPMVSLMYINNKNLIYMSILLSSIISTIFSLNHQSIRIIMAYSSINHLSWMLLNILITKIGWMLYFFSYSIINMSIMMIFHKFKIYFINQLFLFSNFKMMKFLIMMNFISMSGLPPMFGFMMKWFSIYSINYNFPSIIIFIMIFLSILTFFLYMRLNISLLMNINLSNKLILLNKFSQFKLPFIIFLMISFNLNLWIMSMWLM